MALSVAQGSFLWAATDTVGTVKTITPGFVAKIVKVWCNGQASATDAASAATNGRLGVGWGKSTTVRVTLAETFEDNEVTADASHALYNDCVLGVVNAPNTDAGVMGPDGKLDLNDIGTDNDIDFIVDDQIAADIRVHWLALGGSDITDTSIAVELTGTVTGNLTISTPGFRPNFCWFAMGKATAVNTGTNDAAWGFGAAVDSTHQGVIAGFANDGANTMQTNKYGLSAECLANFSTFDAVNFRAAFVQMEDTGYTINRIENAAAVSYVFIAVAIKGGSWFVDEFVTSTTLNATIARSGYGFQPSAGMVYSVAEPESTADTSVAHSECCMGAYLSAGDRQAVTATDQDAVGTSAISVAVEYDEVYVNLAVGAATIDGLMDVSTIDSDGITYIMDDGDNAANWCWTWNVGPAAAVAPVADYESVLPVNQWKRIVASPY